MTVHRLPFDLDLLPDTMQRLGHHLAGWPAVWLGMAGLFGVLLLLRRIAPARKRLHVVAGCVGILACATVCYSHLFTEDGGRLLAFSLVLFSLGMFAWATGEPTN